MDISRPKTTDSSTPKSKISFNLDELHPKHKLGIIVILSVVSLLLISSVFAAGYFYGQNVAIQNAPKNNGVFGAIGDSLAFMAPTSGEVTRIDKRNLGLKLADGSTKLYSLDETTKVTQQDTTLALADVKKGQQVTVFTKSKDNTGKDLAITRIIVR